ncbi:CinA family protein [Streptomonospora nanhaiensis]|uniref:CinA family protein n=1 Tax=Streptomonospora nanhaiensis TaxID=1323731 RepID=UPI001C382EB7|nr:nicotinamide-nucleotide amidohydrolase family protein [Streptomonospora nanhaiensis]MBV2363117.1 nicotinamide-nucleotide amidohydrolase family protein [Streptomonospora nanhaiensis]MBX9390381.1 nicotinamide-nucleotide amidohydrolase family protein [Streptomonospora nanhaiensis]
MDAPRPTGPGVAAAAAAHRALAALGATAATAESLTGGLIGATLTAVPGASATYRGGVVAYATDLKAALLGVPRDLLEAHGAVHPEVAAAMAEGARLNLAATFGLAVTGVAGPEPQDGRAVGTVFAAVAGPGGSGRVCELRLTGDRAAIRYSTTEQALSLLAAEVAVITGK